MTRSNRYVIAFSTAIALASGSVWLGAQQSDDRPLASLLPQGALLYLEAKDFHHLVAEWNASGEKKAWLASDNFGVLSRSRLVQRLAEAQDQFAPLAGVNVEFNLLNEIAGGRSAFAFYDLPSLKFVYLTRLGSSRRNQSELWRAKTKYQAREAAGIRFYVNVDAANHRTVCLASYKDWLVVATGENEMAQTLALLSGVKAASLATAVWFTDVTARASAAGDLRLVYNLDALLPTAQFRTYWIQGNASELKPFTSGIADLFEVKNGFEETRLMLKRGADAAEQAVNPQPSSLDAVVGYAPKESSLYRAWSKPDRDLLTQVLQQVVLSEPMQIESLDRLAPQTSSEAPDAGSASDFETRIDQAPSGRKQAESVTGLVEAVQAMQPTALLHVQATVDLSDDVFVMPQSGAVIECQRPDRAAIDRALQASAGILHTGSLDPLQVSVSGNAIVISRLNLASASTTTSLRAGTTYAAAFNKATEWPRYKKLFSLIDRSALNPETAPSQNGPAFFSGNIRSLGDTLRRLERASILTQDGTGTLRETVHYELSAP